jgi:hypothetical protein
MCAPPMCDSACHDTERGVERMRAPGVDWLKADAARGQVGMSGSRRAGNVRGWRKADKVRKYS